MPAVLVNIGASALISLLLVLPLMVMEVVNRRSFNEGFPFFLFFVIWLNLFAFILILLPIAYTLRTGGRLLAHPVNLLIVGFLLTAFAVGLSSLLIDQWPCFIGVPNCD